MNFAQALRNEAAWTRTENGAHALNTTGTALLDMYATLAAMRSRPALELIRKFELAYLEDPLGALRCLFYVRDIRGGQGERMIFRTLLSHIADRYPEAVAVNLPCIPFYGRWDDLYALIDTPVENEMWLFMKAQLEQDIQNMIAGRPVSLLAKWLKKANSSNDKTKQLGIYTAKKLDLPVYKYKRISSKLRKYLDVVEIKMSAGQWEKIDYSTVPSRAMMIYRKAFTTRDPNRFQAFLNAVEQGQQKIQAATLYPYDIVEKVLYKSDRSPVLKTQWDALPDYVEGETNILVMADVSGSMYGRPMASSIALAAYFAERNQGAFHNLFMTFSAHPQIVQLMGRDIFDKISFISRADWGYDTNFESAMQLVLEVAVRNRCTQAELPKALVCITDMEFNAANRSGRSTFYANIQRMFRDAGYEAPALVFWNVNARNDTFHAQGNDEGAILVAGQSAVTFRNLIQFLNGNAPITPVEQMYEVLNSERYQQICLPE